MKQLESQSSAFNITLEPNDAHRLASLRGQFDDNLHLIEQRLKVEIRSRDNFFAVFGDEDDAKHAIDVIFNLYQETAHYSDVTPEEVHLHLRQFERPKPMDQSAHSVQSVNDIDNFSIIRTKKGILNLEELTSNVMFGRYKPMILTLVLVQRAQVKLTWQSPVPWRHYLETK